MDYRNAYRFDPTHDVRRIWRIERTGIESDAATVDYATAQKSLIYKRSQTTWFSHFFVHYMAMLGVDYFRLLSESYLNLQT